jgi:signal transduction histidine kinase
MSDQQINRFYGMKKKQLMALLLVAICAVFTLFVWWIAAQVDSKMRDDLLQQTRLVAQAVNIQRILTLSGTEADLDNPNYRRLNEQLSDVRSANPKCRILYLVGRRADLPVAAGLPAIGPMQSGIAQAGGSVFFFVDSEPVNSKKYSPPGHVYDDVPEALGHVFVSRTAAVVGPITNCWGVWISALVPLTNPQTGAIVAVLGMDIDSRDWKWDVAARTALPVGMMLVLLIGVTVAFISTRSVDVSPKPVMQRLLPSMAVVVVLLTAGAWTLLWQLHQQQLAREMAADISDISGALLMSLNQNAHGMATATQIIVANPNVQKAVCDADSDSLLAAWQPVLETLRQENGLSHLYFLDANRLCLLRVHRPEQRGDIITRFTAVEAERTGKTTSGIELGPLGTFTLRVVQPILETGRLVGYVELGKEIEEVLETMHTRSNNQLAVVIRKKHLNQQAWENGMRMIGKTPDWDRLPRSVVIYASQGRLPDAFASWADSFADEHVHGETNQDIVFDGKDMLVSAIPLQEASGEGVGDLLILRDISADKEAFARLMGLSQTAGGVVLSLLLGFIYVLLRRTDAGIRVQQAALQESEARLRQANETLEQRVLERSRERDTIHAQMVIQEKMATVGQLAAGVAHELNNPFNFVSMNFVTLTEYFEDVVEMFQVYRKLAAVIQNTNPHLPESEAVHAKEADLQVDFILNDAPALFKESRRGFDRIARIIQSMLDFSHVDSTGDFTSFNINDGIEDTLVIAKNEYKYVADVTTDLGDLPDIRCMPDQINQVFLNLIVNCAHAIETQNRSDNGRIAIRTWQDETDVYCEIADDGPGIPADIQARIFEPFFTTKPPGRGTGLGLSICYDIIVEKHNGTLEVHCPESGGTVFSICIPINP